MGLLVGWIGVNVVLALVPVLLGGVVAWLGSAMVRKRDWRLWLALAPVLALWLIFLPNTCYLFTEPRHFLGAVDRGQLWLRTNAGDAAALDALTRWGVITVLFVLTGILTFGLAIRPVRRFARQLGVVAWWWSPLFFVLLSLGVYLGLIVRFNSWDLFTRPEVVLRTAVAVTDNPRLTWTILGFGGFLWAAYEVIDIWFDGFLLRAGRRFARAPVAPVAAHD